MFEALSALLLLNFLGMLSPGPDMMLVLRHASRQPQQAKYCVFGVLSGFAIHISLALAGISLLIQQSPWLFQLLQWLGAAFLIFLGIQALFSRKVAEQQSSEKSLSPNGWSCYLSGLSCNLLNPKILVFVVAVFSQFVAADTLWSDKLILGGALLLETSLLWWGLFKLLTQVKVQRKLSHYQNKIDKLSGGTLLGLGALLGLH